MWIRTLDSQVFSSHTTTTSITCTSYSMASNKEVLTSSGSRHISFAKQNKKLFVALFASLLLIAAVICVIASRQNSHVTSHSHTIIKSSCSSTLYPEHCFTAVAKSPEVFSKVTNPVDVIVASLNITIASAKNNSNLIRSVTKKRNTLTKRQQIALHDCLALLDDTLDEIHEAVNYLSKYPNNKSPSERADDLKTLLSSAITNQETCLEGFSHSDEDRELMKVLLEAEIHLGKLCSNALAMIRYKTDKDMATEEEEEEDIYDVTRWPKWLSARDRRLLRSGKVVPDVVVAADGSGDFTTVVAAVEASPKKSEVRYVIKIKAGVYEENVEVPSSKKNIMFLGAGGNRTIITGNRSVGGGNATTFNSSTVG